MLLCLCVLLCVSELCVFPVSLRVAQSSCLHVSQCHPLVGTPCHSLAVLPPDSPLYYYFFCIPPWSSPSSSSCYSVVFLPCLSSIVSESAQPEIFGRKIFTLLCTAHISHLSLLKYPDPGLDSFGCTATGRAVVPFRQTIISDIFCLHQVALAEWGRQKSK